MSAPVLVSLFPEVQMRPCLFEGLRALGELRFVPLASSEGDSDAEILVGTSGMKVGADVLARFPNVRMFADYGVGFDGYDVPEFVRRGVALSHTPDVLSEDVADFGLALLLALTRRIPAGDSYVRSGQWGRSPFPLGERLFGRRLGIAGLGRIGRVLARRAQAFDLEVGYTSRSPKDGPWKRFGTIEELAAWCDFLVILVPGGADTRHLVGRAVLDALGPQGYLVNIARGSLVDAEELVSALKESRIAGAALDVFENEPHVPEELRNLPNVVLAPHQGSATEQTRDAMSRLVVDNIRAWLEGRPLLTPVAGTESVPGARGR